MTKPEPFVCMTGVESGVEAQQNCYILHQSDTESANNTKEQTNRA